MTALSTRSVIKSVGQRGTLGAQGARNLFRRSVGWRTKLGICERLSVLRTLLTDFQSHLPPGNCRYFSGAEGALGESGSSLVSNISRAIFMLIFCKLSCWL